MKITPALLLLALAWALLQPAVSLAAPAVRVRESLDADWRFTRGDPDGTGTNLNYAAVRPWLLPLQNGFTARPPITPPKENLGESVPYTQPDFDDHNWRQLNLPHDFGIEGPFDLASPGETGKLPWSGVAWYRKHFAVPAEAAGKQLYLDMDGAMSCATVWLNGRCLGGWPYGYASWRVDLTPFIKFGATNTLAIRLDNPPDSSRWYPGGGIYRHVWLTQTAPVHVGLWGTYITTPQVSPLAATVQLQTCVENHASTEAKVMVSTWIYELQTNGLKSKKFVAEYVTGGLKIAAGTRAETVQTLTVSSPKLWDVQQPHRYVAVTLITQAGRVVDAYETPFGIRTLQFTADQGLLLNGKRVPLQGVCNHADLGALGTAVNTRGLERQLEILRAMGGNAIRTSHNPPAPELLDLCDRMGFLVMDETFDCWGRQKKPNDYHRLFADWHEADTRMLIRRDRNHPSVILWSIGNEIREQERASQFAPGRELAAIARAEDPTRPVTAACDNRNAGYNGFQDLVDVFGYNYKPQEYAKFHTNHPAIPLYGSETASTLSSRGEYFFPASGEPAQACADFQVSSYDLYAPSYACTPDVEFAQQDKNPFVLGEFVWTGFDYLGEPTPYTSDLSTLSNYSDPAERARAEAELAKLGRIRPPSRSSYFGILDLAGFPKDRYYLYQARWRPDFPMAHILPHWNWPERQGKITPVHVYTSGDEAELFLNGQSLGRKKKGPFEYRLRWDEVKYAPGELKVVAYKAGRPWATDRVRTAGPAARLRLKADRTKITADGHDLSFITVTVADRQGQLVPRSKNHIQFKIEGPGEIVAVDNGDATSFEPFQASERRAYNGLALVIIRATQPGKITLRARAEGLTTATVRISARP